jgi:hypothetical protein
MHPPWRIAAEDPGYLGGLRLKPRDAVLAEGDTVFNPIPWNRPPRLIEKQDTHSIIRPSIPPNEGNEKKNI